MTHTWTECDDIVALYFYRFGVGRLGLSLENASNALGITPSSMKMRLRNFKSLEGAGGLSNVAQQSRKIFERYHAFSEGELRTLAIDCLQAQR